MKTALILMTALPPTKGHKLLIDYAYNFLVGDTTWREGFELHVLINGRKIEPISLAKRFTALIQEFKHFNYPNIIFHCYEGDLPQEPDEHPDFWKIWKNIIKVETGRQYFDYVFASDSYGSELANQMHGQFIPCNMYREVIDISATRLRDDPLAYFEELLPSFQEYAKQTITIFGPESVGKTTLSKALAKKVNGYYVPEWAREYLEQVAGPEVTEEKMLTILKGQSALERSVDNLKSKPFIIRDTDILSTIGYYKLWQGEIPHFTEPYFNKADYYIIQNDQIPFTPDPLRYGGDKRESDNKFWINILEEYKLPYYQIQSISPEKQLIEAEKVVKNIFYNHNNWRFIR